MPSTIQQIARKVGVSVASVSLALRDMGRISEVTRAKIKAAARELDYATNPIISKACSMVRTSQSADYRETMAFLVEWPLEEAGHYEVATYNGALTQTASLGCKLEVFVMSAKRTDQQRLSRMLRARGIRGLIITPRLWDTHPRLHLDWQNFAAVQIERTIWSPAKLHSICTSDYHRFLEAMHLLKRVGYRRIGMAIEPRQDYHQRGVFNAAYLMLQSKLPPSKQIPSLLSYGPWSEATFQTWFERYKPDVLYIHQNPDIFKWIKNLGLDVPGDISVFCDNLQDSVSSGLRRDYESIGRSAVSMIWMLLGSNTLGLVENPYCWLVDELWQPGTTLSKPIDDYISGKKLLAPNRLRQ
ncbi:MAG: LacI family DNA-binding transcriptional regulator [Candidatus Methylacidiphilales bacterium]|nr:LacI family DNA-binding transcriptional regulator [Candidatus Methylacidiphilales bacterium]